MNKNVKLKFKIILVLFAFLHFDSFCQVEYIVSFNDRNIAIKLTNEAIKNVKEEKSDEAIDKLFKAISIDSTYRETYLILFQTVSLKPSNSGRVMKALIKGKRIFEEDDELHYYCGEIFRLNFDYDNAILEYDFATKYAKTNGEDFYLVPYYYLNRANCYMKKNNLSKAIEDYNYLVNLKPDFLAGVTNRGICYFKLGKKDEACKDWKNAVDKGYGNANEYYSKYCKK